MITKYKYMVRDLVLVSGCIWVVGCASIPPAPAPISGQTINTQDELGPILGPVTKGKVLDRLKGYPVCGMVSEEQKLTLKVKIYDLNPKAKAKIKIKTADNHSLMPMNLLEIECFFFGIQGLYEYVLLTPKDGRVYPLSFQGAQPIKSKLNGAEKISPTAKTQGRSEVCGVPTFDLSKRRLSSLCKAESEGGCGAYAVYDLVSENEDTFDASKAYFKLNSAHFQSCSTPKRVPPDQWPTVSLPE
jgi:hypothetical protein